MSSIVAVSSACRPSWRSVGRRPAGAVVAGAVGAVAAAGVLVPEAASHELDEDILEARLGLLEGQDLRTEAAERPDHGAQGGVVGEDQVDGHGLPIDRAAIAGRVGRRHDTGQRVQGGRAALQSIELEAEDRLALDALLELIRAADRQDLAVVDDRDALAQLIGLGHVVGGQEDRSAGDGGLPGDHELADLAGGGDIEPERRLVEEQDPRVVEQATGDVHLLALPGRERADPLQALVAHADRLDELVDAAPAFLPRQAVELAEHPELLADREDAVARLLAAGDHVHDPADLLLVAGHVEAEDPGRAFARQQQRGQDLDEGRLARAVGTEQAEELAGGDVEIDVLERDDGRRLDLVDAPETARFDGGRTGRGGHGHPRAGRLWKDGEDSTEVSPSRAGAP